MSSRARLAVVWGVLLALIGALLGVRIALRDRPLERLQQQALADGRIRYQGSWHLPRGGPYVFGTDSPGLATLRIDGHELYSASAYGTARVVLAPGVARVELIAPEGVILLWHPPGRRGPLEYVSPSSLSPDPPERAHFPAHAGWDPLSAAVASLCAAIFLGLLAWTFRGTLLGAPRAVRWTAVAIFVLALALRLFDADGAGPTWDEDNNWSAGKNYVLNLLDFDLARERFAYNFEHPPLMKYIAGLGALWADGYGPSRWLMALVLALACAVVVVVSHRLFGDRNAAGFAGLIAALSPHLIAHGKVVGHEAPAVLWSTALVWACLRIADLDPASRRDLVCRLAVVGVMFGAAVFSRFSTGVIAPIGGVALLLYAPEQARWRVLGAALVVVPLVALALGYLTWPRLWPAPLHSLSEAWARLSKPHGAEMYLGHYTNQPARHYFLVYLWATVPLGVWLLFGAWAAQAVRRRQRADAVVLAWIAVPLLMGLSPVRQDGVRYILPSLVGVAVAAGAGAGLITRWLAARLPRAREIVLALVAAYLGLVCVRVHPYYLDYYGEQVGGPAGVARHRSFELAWWGEGLDRAIAYVNEHADEGARVHKACIAPSHLAWLRHDLWDRVARRPQDADWLIEYQPYTGQCSIPPDAELVFEVRASGAPLARVYRRR